MFEIFFLFGGIFGFLGGLSAFLITWSEMEHHLADRKKLFWTCFQSGVFSFFVFVVLSILTGLLWQHFFPDK
jgi:hypothetical protein